MESKLRSLRGAALAITEVQQQENSEKEKEVLVLTSELGTKLSIIADLENRIKIQEYQLRKVGICATAGFVIVNRLSERNSDLFDALKHKDIQLSETLILNLEKDALCKDQDSAIKESEQQIQALRMELECSEESCTNLKVELSEEQDRVHAMERKLDEVQSDDILKTKEKLDEFKLGVSTLNSCLNDYTYQDGGSQIQIAQEFHALSCENGDSKDQVS